MYTIWMKPGFRSVQYKQHALLSMPNFVLNFKHNQADKNGSQSSSAFVLMERTSISPLVIFKGEKISSEWILPANLHQHWRFSCSMKDWTSNTHGLEWLRRCFEPITREKANGELRVLILDGHESHVTGNFIAHCMDNNILLLRLSPHTSHLLQPLDIGLFGLSKKRCRQKWIH